MAHTMSPVSKVPQDSSTAIAENGNVAEEGSAINQDGRASLPVASPSDMPHVNSNPHDDIVEGITEASNAVADAEKRQREAQSARMLRIANKAGHLMEKAGAAFSTAESVGTTLEPVYESDPLQTVRDGISSLAEKLPGLIKALDEVAKIHPFIAVAVGAFKVVVELDVKRRDNDKKITVLFSEMRDMMAVLLELRTVKDEETPGVDGTTIKARMQELVRRTADDIKDCANACDTYAKKRLLVKVIKSSMWDDKLKGYMTLFADRRKAFTFALEMHVGRAVDDVNRLVAAMDVKLDIMLDMFATLSTPEQRQLGEIVRSRGGPTAVMADDRALEDLMRVQGAAAGGHELGSEHTRQSDSLEALKAELFDSPESAVRKNFELFERKFTMQQRELADEIRGVVVHESDRVIDAILSGPHDRIKDKDIYEIWKEMRWRGHVKARHFILALRDYWIQKVEDWRRGESTDPRISEVDQGFLDVLDVSRLQAIAEAFDEDASGFITVAEVNEFTSSRPQGYTVCGWLGYWAIGWQVTTTTYIDNIVDCFARMFALLPRLRPENKRLAYEYLDKVWRPIITLTAAFNGGIGPDDLYKILQSHVDAEEKRLRESLETVKYNIDALDTLRLITGPGRIEKCLFPLLHLLLKRDLDIFRLSQKVIISKEELADSADTLLYVMDGVQHRYDDLVALFKQQNLDPKEKFKNYAFGLFEHWSNVGDFWSLSNLEKMNFTESDASHDTKAAHLDLDLILNHPCPVDLLYSPRSSAPLSIPPPPPDNEDKLPDALKKILGVWNGFLGDARWPASPMVSFTLCASPHADMVEARTVAAYGTEYTVLGQFNADEGAARVYTFTRVFADGKRTQYLEDALGTGGGALAGTWGTSTRRLTFPFYWSRVPQEVLVHRPPPKEFKADKTGALWKFALAAARGEARRRLFSWSYIKERRERRIASLEILREDVRKSPKSKTPKERRELADARSAIDRFCTFDDVRCFHTIEELRRRSVHGPMPTTCSSCSQKTKTRLTCLQCSTYGAIDICEAATCLDATVALTANRTHLPTHDMVKIRRDFFHCRDIGKVLRAVKAAQERLAGTLKRSAETLACVSCNEPVRRPYWYCLECTSDTFICAGCDAQKGGVSVDHHADTHILLRCLPLPPGSGLTVEERLSSLEGQVATFANRFDGLDDRLSRIERLLERLVVAQGPAA